MLFYVYTVAPSIQDLIEDEIRDQTENVTFLCQTVGEPVPDISWYFNSVMINVSYNSSKYLIMSRLLNMTTTENTLTVYNVTSLDVGTYTCNLTNFIGSSISSGILTVTSKLILLHLLNSYTHYVYVKCFTLFMSLISYTIVCTLCSLMHGKCFLLSG